MRLFNEQCCYSATYHRTGGINTIFIGSFRVSVLARLYTYMIDVFKNRGCCPVREIHLVTSVNTEEHLLHTSQ